MLWSAPVGTLRSREAAELAAEEDERVLQQAALFEVCQQRRRRLIRRGRVAHQASVQVVVLIPAGVADLDEADAGLAQSSRHDALPRKAAGGSGLDAVRVEDVLRLGGDVEQFRNLALHLEGELVRLDDAVELIGRAGRQGEVAVHGLGEVDLLALEGLERGGLEVGEVAAVVDAGALEVGGKERAAVVDRAAEVGRGVIVM